MRASEIKNRKYVNTYSNTEEIKLAFGFEFK